MGISCSLPNNNNKNNNNYNNNNYYYKIIIIIIIIMIIIIILITIFPYRFILNNKDYSKYGNWTPVTVVGFNPKIT